MRRTIVALAFCTAGFSPARAATEPVRAPAEAVVEFVAAFTRHDLPAFLSFTHPEIEWLTITGSTVAVETSGREALDASMTSYFASCPSCRSTVEISAVNGDFVTAVETATWESKGTLRAQSSLSVYEFVEGKIRRVWYYPAVAADPPRAAAR